MRGDGVVLRSTLEYLDGHSDNLVDLTVDDMNEMLYDVPLLRALLDWLQLV